MVEVEKCKRAVSVYLPARNHGGVIGLYDHHTCDRKAKFKLIYFNGQVEHVCGVHAMSTVKAASRQAPMTSVSTTRKSLIIYNGTSIPKRLIRLLAAWARPPSLKGAVRLEVAYNGYNHFAGRAFPSALSTPTIKLRIPEKYHETKCVITPFKKNTVGIRNHNPSKPYLPALTTDLEEELLLYLAHEFRHIQQGIIRHHLVNARSYSPRFTGHVPRYVYRARGFFSESDCDAYAIRVVRAWRRAQRKARFESGETFSYIGGVL